MEPFRKQSLAFLALAVAFSLLAPAQQPPKVPAVPDPPLIDGQGYKDLLAQHRGKPLLVNFWATWCEPCRDEYPMVNELARKYATQGLVVVGISLDGDGELTLMRRFIDRTRPVFRNYRKRPGNEEAFINLVNPRWTGAIPATFLYDRDGRQAGQLVGEHNRAEFEKAIEGLLRARGARRSRSLPADTRPVDSAAAFARFALRD